MARKYATIANIEDYALLDIDADFEPKVLNWIESVSREMDRMADRRLVADETSNEDEEVGFSEKYFSGNGRGYLFVDDAVAISEVGIGDMYGANEVIVEDANYLTFPRVYADGRAIRRINLKSAMFGVGQENIRIKARWGLFADVPKDIEFACTVLVAGIINGQKKGGKAIKSESIGSYSVTYTDEKGVSDFDRAMAIIQSYRSYAF